MARSFTAAIMRAARASERAHRANVRSQAAYARARERDARANERAARQYYLESRADEVADLNEELVELNEQLASILLDGLTKSGAIEFDTLRKELDLSELQDRFRDLQPIDESIFAPKPLSFIDKLLPGSADRHAAAKADGERRLQAAINEHRSLHEQRESAIKALKIAVDTHNSEIDEFEAGVAQGDPDAVKAYYELVLASSDYPENFPNRVRIGYVPESKQLIIDLQLPNLQESIPEVEKYSFVKSADEIRKKARTERSRKIQYADVISQIALRCVHEAFAAGDEELVEIVAFNGFVIATDPSTGRQVEPYLLSLRIGRESFSALELSSVDAAACLKRLNANVSKSPDELVAVKPVVDINMADPRFIDEQDVLSMLDTRPNLMELTPGEFESLITNLFQSMGLETKLTQASRDGGVDCVAFDPRPVLGGKVIVQAKRYKNTVGVSAVRDLFGTMHNEGASKGILVTTSGYGKAAFSFADGKPIELLSGSNLLYLLKEHAGIDAKIEAPDGWSDPILDVST
ncbi:restriction endonuclease [uncultured Brevundimonas sp.]|uniref:restriction endonuclease n=1 Tax=uncultured Brevundimonas sp. TaxID=213418 RepID=UPI0025E84BA3|nr:restriction endonuclease [uncultured Brevundimonas sp.]